MVQILGQIVKILQSLDEILAFGNQGGKFLASLLRMHVLNGI